MHRTWTAIAAAAAVGVALGLWLRVPAQAQEDSGTPRLKCKVFPYDLADPPLLETADRTTEVGQWIGAREDEGWLLYTVDFETSQKPTGYPQGWTQVCMYPQ